MNSVDFSAYLQLQLLANPLQDWLIGLSIGLVTFLLLQVVLRAGLSPWKR